MAVVYAAGFLIGVCCGGKTTEKVAAVNTLFAPLSPPQRPKLFATSGLTAY
jgi:hypothetical protein